MDNPAAASIAADGKFTAFAMEQDTPAKVTATYSEGVSRAAVVPPPPRRSPP